MIFGIGTDIAKVVYYSTEYIYGGNKGEGYETYIMDYGPGADCSTGVFRYFHRS